MDIRRQCLRKPSAVKPKDTMTGSSQEILEMVLNRHSEQSVASIFTAELLDSEIKDAMFVIVCGSGVQHLHLDRIPELWINLF